MDQSHWILAIGWVLFGIIHSAAATDKFKSAVARFSKGIYKHYRPLYIMFAATSFGIILIYQLNTTSYTLFTPDRWLSVLAIVGGMAGAGIMLASVYKYFCMGVALNADTAGQKLVITGLNKFVRHPLYAGTLLAVWSVFFIEPRLSTLVADIVISLYTFIGIHFEERKLLLRFGNEYAVYKRNVPMMIPYCIRFRLMNNVYKL